MVPLVVTRWDQAPAFRPNGEMFLWWIFSHFTPIYYLPADAGT